MIHYYYVLLILIIHFTNKIESINEFMMYIVFPYRFLKSTEVPIKFNNRVSFRKNRK